MKKSSSLKKEKQPKASTDSGNLAKTIAPKELAFDFSQAYLSKGNVLQPKPAELLITKPVARKFQSEKELQQLVLKNTKILFGENTLLIDTKKNGIAFSGGCTPEGILLDLGNIEKPQIYLIKTALAKQNFSLFFMQMTVFFAFIKNRDNLNPLKEVIDQMINKNKELKKELMTEIMGKQTQLLYNSLLKQKPYVLLIMDAEKKELTEITETYSETWGSMVNLFVIKKFLSDKNTICTMQPDFADINKKAKKETGKVKSTEEDHLENVSDAVKDIYIKIKKELMKTDKTVEFNPKKFYISIRKNKNLAFMSLGRKRISLVVVNPEKETRKLIKHHEIKTLTEKVQKFWNGPSCTVMLENTDHLDEVINLLKKLVKEA